MDKDEFEIVGRSFNREHPIQESDEERRKALLDEAVGILKVIHSRVGLFLSQIDQRDRR